MEFQSLGINKEGLRLSSIKNMTYLSTSENNQLNSLISWLKSSVKKKKNKILIFTAFYPKKTNNLPRNIIKKLDLKDFKN